MKDIIHFNFLFSLLLLLPLTNQSYNLDKINIIPDAYSNSKPDFAWSEGKKEEYAYYSFDFEYHNKVNKGQKNVAYFKVLLQ